MMMIDQEMPRTEREWRAHQAFYKLTLAQRDAAWTELAAAETGLAEAERKIEALAKENQRLTKENEALAKRIERLWKRLADEGIAE